MNQQNLNLLVDESTDCMIDESTENNEWLMRLLSAHTTKVDGSTDLMVDESTDFKT